MQVAGPGAEDAEVPSWEQVLLELATVAGPMLPRETGAEPAPAELAGAYARCEEVTREHSATFFAATRLMPREQRRAVRALYAFCRVSDDIVDTPGEGRAERLAAWRAANSSGADGGDRVLAAWHDTRTRFGVPPVLGEQLLDALEGDLEGRTFERWNELTRYCYGVAATVGLMAMRIIGVRAAGAEPYAIRLGVAMQLTNILRDVGEDREQGRLYLPLEDLERFGVTPGQVMDGRVDDRWRALMAFEVARARELYRSARPGVGMLRREGRLAVAAALELYSRILDDIERAGYDVFSRRARVPGWKRLALLPGVAWTAMRARGPEGARA